MISPNTTFWIFWNGLSFFAIIIICRRTLSTAPSALATLLNCYVLRDLLCELPPENLDPLPKTNSSHAGETKNCRDNMFVVVDFASVGSEEETSLSCFWHGAFWNVEIRHRSWCTYLQLDPSRVLTMGSRMPKAAVSESSGWVHRPHGPG